ncbi:MAG: TIGR04211 family SH3 domain-containing protein [Proteobacteria bacterium]|nr:TIGR04211 family SH3 domain-containing protein [Desulfobulbaceae bacterium]MBU4153778.1 TIGR04211 family SH3 domain-containing protein [Pseudomonadota bacterium]
MPEIKKLLTTLPSLLVCAVAMASSAHADQRYVVDTIVVSLREGPGSQYKAIKTVQTGQSLEVIESKNNFIRVRTSDGNEGWLPSQYAVNQPTNANVVKDLQEEITSLRDQNDLLTAQIAGKEPHSQSGESELSKLKTLQTKLDLMTEQYHVLKADAQDIVRIQDENKRLKSETTVLQASLRQLQENKKTFTGNIYWFLAGGSVFLVGWVTGKLSFRRQRHSLTL